MHGKLYIKKYINFQSVNIFQ